MSRRIRELGLRYRQKAPVGVALCRQRKVPDAGRLERAEVARPRSACTAAAAKCVVVQGVHGQERKFNPGRQQCCGLTLLRPAEAEAEGSLRLCEVLRQARNALEVRGSREEREKAQRHRPRSLEGERGGGGGRPVADHQAGVPHVLVPGCRGHGNLGRLDDGRQPWVRGEFLLAKQKFVPAAEGGAVVVDGASGEAAVLELGEEAREVSKERVPQVRSTNGIEPNP